MQIIAEHKLIEFAQRHSTARPALLRWLELMERGHFSQEFVEATSHPEAAARWLIDLLNLFAGIVNRSEDLCRVVVTETEYQQLLAVLEDLIWGVGQDEDHPLSDTMALVGVLIKSYKDAHFPKLADLYPELAKKIKGELAIEGSKRNASTLERTETDLAPAVFFSVGFILSEAGKVEETICAYDLALRLKSDYAEAYNNRGTAKKALGQYKAAIADFDKTIHLNPNLAEPYTNRGAVMLELGQYKKAIADHDKAIALKPDYAGAYSNRGIVKSEIGKHKEAVADHDKAIELDPNNCTAIGFLDHSLNQDCDRIQSH